MQEHFHRISLAKESNSSHSFHLSHQKLFLSLQVSLSVEDDSHCPSSICFALMSKPGEDGPESGPGVFQRSLPDSAILWPGICHSEQRKERMNKIGGWIGIIQVGWKPGQPDLVADNPAHSRVVN